ncbi:MAG: catechol 2,3-dioxygenase-like lactoylglutathione lyase family enzyme [Myxococcota bacterium]|jgi:catechol 2,3-dioxygenase-like lactoylglutathione lyase family enzyme
MEPTMSQENRSIMSHVSIGTADFDRAAAFYDAVLATIGARRLMSHPGAIAYGKRHPESWLQTPIDGTPATVANGVHFGFFADSKTQVDAFYKAALEPGATGDGPPGPRKEYGAPYDGCFVRDLDGHKIEPVFYDMALHQAQ